ncbi:MULTISPECIES: hypothetical protein [Saccharothrix]|uniref:hypothetical protein n=1 Tax=Saccharothrix TaxID=2071 RepID=UPI0011612B45|nr:hypothetical protein [Saccharothrix sp. CB00851]
MHEVDIRQTRFAWRATYPSARSRCWSAKPALAKSTIVVDLAAKLTTGQLNGNSIVRPQLEKLRLLAQQTGTTMLGIGNFRKATAGVIKSNAVSVSGVSSLSCRTDFATVMADDGGETAVGRIVWQGHSATSVVDLLQRSAYDDGDELADAAAWLTDYLMERGGEAPVLDLLAEGHRAGFSKDTLKRAGPEPKSAPRRPTSMAVGCGGSIRRGALFAGRRPSSTAVAS